MQFSGSVESCRGACAVTVEERENVGGIAGTVMPVIATHVVTEVPTNDTCIFIPPIPSF